MSRRKSGLGGKAPREIQGKDFGGIGRGYSSALLAMGLLIGVRSAAGQAVVPVDIGGANTTVTPVQQPIPPAAPGNNASHGAPPAQSVAQAVVPVDVATQPATPAAAGPAATLPTAIPPVAPATPIVTPPVEPAAAVPPAAPINPPMGPTPAAPAPPSIPLAPAAPVTPVTPVAPGQGPVVAPPPAAIDDGKEYPITGIKIDYKNANPEQPPIADLLNTKITLGVLNDAYVAARPGVETVTLNLGDIGKTGPQKIRRSGIAAIYGHIVHYFNAQSIIGVFVVVDANDIDANDNDIRPADRKTLQLIVVTSTVKQVRTVAIGEMSKDADRVNNPRDASIRQHSPLQPAAEGSTAPRMDLLRKDALDEYVLRLNRLPGRHVDVAVSGTNEPGGVNLDYLVSESRPWYAFFQISNTGTSQTSEWRERLGFVDNQLTGHDDSLSLDYITAGFDTSHAVIASYELPFFGMDRVRDKTTVSWNEFTASDVGLNKEHFTGSQWLISNELTANVFQHRELFVDAVAGLRFRSVETENQTTVTQGEADYTEPYIGLRLDRTTDLATTTGALMLNGYFTQANQKEIDGLGRVNSTQDPVVLQFQFSHSFFLEPLLDAERFAAGSSTLAHELYIAAHGQWAFNDRLFPNIEDVAGGLYTVRGYPESIVAGDSVIVATGEYRFHLPRILAVQPDPSKTPFLWDKNFRFSPQQAYGHPDWDLIARAFVDVAEVVNSQRQSFESDATLVGTGVGLEFQFRQNFNLRVDWGVALTDIPDEVKAGSNRFHITSTILY